MKASGKTGKPRHPAAPPSSFTMPLGSSSSSPFREFLDDLLTMAEQVRELRIDLARSLGVSEPQYRLIWAIAELQGSVGVTVTSVARRLKVTSAFVTTEVNKLCRLDMVSKKSNPGDGRSVLISLTPEGASALKSVAVRAQKINDSYFRNISESDFEVLGEIVARLIVNGSEALSLLEGGSSSAPGPFALLGGRSTRARQVTPHERPERKSRRSRKERKHV